MRSRIPGYIEARPQPSPEGPVAPIEPTDKTSASPDGELPKPTFGVEGYEPIDKALRILGVEPPSSDQL